RESSPLPALRLEFLLVHPSFLGDGDPAFLHVFIIISRGGEGEIIASTVTVATFTRAASACLRVNISD
ncbi:hypothetical protein A2U01_0068686, partial [Trifolium medium]|nr:hypothetical protein [Trifolium medium]